MQVRDGQAGPFCSSYSRQLGAGLREGLKQFNKEATQALRLRLVIVGPQLGFCQGWTCSRDQAEEEPRPEPEQNADCRPSAFRGRAEVGCSSSSLQCPCDALPAQAEYGGKGVTALTLH